MKITIAKQMNERMLQNDNKNMKNMPISALNIHCKFINHTLRFFFLQSLQLIQSQKYQCLAFQSSPILNMRKRFSSVFDLSRMQVCVPLRYIVCIDIIEGQNLNSQLTARKQLLCTKRLMHYFSAQILSQNETVVQNNSLNENRSIQTNEKFRFQVSTTVNFAKIYAQNRRRLKEVSARIQLGQVLFDQDYIKSQLIDTKYFFADIVLISSHVILYLSAIVQGPKQNPVSKVAVTSVHLRFLLGVYHMYIKQLRSYKQQICCIIQHFFDHSLSHETFQICNNLELFVYLRKYIDSETVLGNGPKIVRMTQKYCIFLQKAHANQSTSQDLQLSLQANKNNKFSQKIIQKSKLLENYVLSYPFLWVSTFGHDLQTDKDNLSEPIVKSYHCFATYFSTLLRDTINYWLNFESSEVQNSKKILLQQFKQAELNKCLNSLKLVLHRLCSILEIPKLMQEKTEKVPLKSNEYNCGQQKYVALAKKYEQNILNILTYLPSQKIAQNKEVKFMRLLIIMKNLFGYHTLRRISDRELTSHLEKLLKNNWNEILLTENEIKRQQINILLGELVSRLVSASWNDNEDILGKYIEKQILVRHENKGRRDNRGQWHQ